MVELLVIPIPDRHFSIYDPAGGTGGMLSVAKEHLLERADTPEEKTRVEKRVTVHGQELSPTNYAVCQADLLNKNDRQATVHLGNSLIPHEPHSKEPGDLWTEHKWRFNRMLSNPPFGVTWGGKDGYEKEARKLEKSRYRAGMPRVNDGALLVLQTMLAKMATPEEGGIISYKTLYNLHCPIVAKPDEESHQAAVQYQGVTTSGGPIKDRSSKGKKAAGPPPVNVSVQDMITEIRARFDITDEEAL